MCSAIHGQASPPQCSTFFLVIEHVKNFGSYWSQEIKYFMSFDTSYTFIPFIIHLLQLLILRLCEHKPALLTVISLLEWPLSDYPAV